MARVVSEEDIIEDKKLRTCVVRPPWEEVVVVVIGAAKAAPGREMARRKEGLILAN